MRKGLWRRRRGKRRKGKMMVRGEERVGRGFGVLESVWVNFCCLLRGE